MVPKFLLNLSTNRITLEKLSAAGVWVSMGAVKPDEPKFGDTLRKLRILGQPDATKPFEVIIALPTDQIKTLQVGKVNLTRDDVLASLGGQTPSDISELCIDWNNTVKGSVIATVARDTLNEVAAFAQQFSFRPIMFVALPGGIWLNNFATFDFLEGPSDETPPRLPPYTTVLKQEKALESELLSSIEHHKNPTDVAETFKIQLTAIQKPISIQMANRSVTLETTPIKPEGANLSVSAPSTKSIVPKRSRNSEIIPFLTANSDPAVLDNKRTNAAPTLSRAEARNKNNKLLKLISSMFKFQKPPIKKITLLKKDQTPLKADIGGKPRYLGFILTTLLLIFMFTVAAWAATDGRKITAPLIAKDLRIIAPMPESNNIPAKYVKSPQAVQPLSNSLKITIKNRPKARPPKLKVLIKITLLSAVSSDTLAAFRPVSRRTLLPEILGSNLVPTKFLTVSSLKPKLRPNSIEIGALAQAPAVPFPSEFQAPTVTSQRSVTKAATIKNILNLRNINLIGISGTKRNPNALVLLANGRVLKVKIGDRLNGGRVTDITAATLTYAKSGISIILKMPRG